jgi:glycosyltransferase involved in cell wall biosynthesis
MKILYFHQHFTTPEIGGGTRSYEFARKLIKRGHTVTMVCGKSFDLNLPRAFGKGIFRGIINGIDVIQIDLPYSNKDGIGKRAFTFVKFSIKSIQIALKEPYDLLFATSTPLTAGVPGIWMKVFGGERRKFVFEVRDLWPELPKALGLRNPILLWGMKLLEKISYQKADACVSLSPGISEGIRRIVPEKLIEMIPNGCDLDLFRPGNREDLQIEGVSFNDTVAVFTGAHGIANGLDAVLDAALELKKRERSDIKIVFIGSGKLKTDLKTRAKAQGLKNCLFLDPVSKIELTKILGSVDVGLMILKNVPAFYYGTSPNKFFDYISAGIPVLNNYPGWISDLILGAKCGMVVEPDNPLSFADALIYFADHPIEGKVMGMNGRKLAENEFSRDILSGKFVDFLESVVN